MGSSAPTAKRIPGASSDSNTEAADQGDADVDLDGAQLDEDAEAGDDVLTDFGDVLDEAHRKATEGRVYNPENERIRIEWLRAYTDAVAEYRELVESAETPDE